MKKIILSLAAVFAFGFANAQETEGGQTAKGKFLIEANTGFGSAEVGGLGSTSFHLFSVDGTTVYNFGADVGYFVMDDLALKAGLGFGGESGDGESTSTVSYKIGAKYYAAKKFPIGLDLTGASIKDVDENPLWLGLQGGYAWFLGKNVAIEPGVRYNFSLNDKYSDKGVFEFNIGFSLFF